METGEQKCNLTDEELIKACRKLLTRLERSGGRLWNMSVPPDPDRDPDILFDELISRFNSLKGY